MEKLSKLLPNWSGLRTLGQSRIVALTALVPFLGTFILFNQQIVDLLLISPDLVARWLGEQEQGTVEASKSFTYHRLVTTYFGLVALGSASFLFAILCPQEIKRHGNILDYVEAEKPLITPARTTLKVTQVVEDYLYHHGTDDDGMAGAQGLKSLRELAYPSGLVLFFEEVIRQISQRSIEGADEDIYSANGNIYIEKVARILQAQLRLQRALWSSFHEAAQDSHTDLLALIYEARDHSRPIARAIISALYGIGFLILLYPTITTLIIIVRRAI